MEDYIMAELLAIKQLLQQQNISKKEVFNLEEAAMYMQVSRSFIYKLTCTNQIPHYVPTGRKIFFKRIELEEWLLQNRHSTDAEIQRQASDYVMKKKRW